MARWLLVEWRTDGTVKYALSNLPAEMALAQAASWWKERRQVEHGYRQLKRELGLDQFEGRSWNGFHHHTTMTFLAYGFLALEQHRMGSAKHADASSEPPDPVSGEARHGPQAFQPYAVRCSTTSIHPAASPVGPATAT